jgi:hypothetical protein
MTLYSITSVQCAGRGRYDRSDGPRKVLGDGIAVHDAAPSRGQ